MKILVVDDSKAMRSIVVRTLRQAGFGGHSIEEAPDGKAALAAIETNPPDLVLSDWNMPEMAGIDLLKNLRGAGKNMPFFFITSEGTEEFKSEAVREGAIDIITKPFTPETLQDKLGGILA